MIPNDDNILEQANIARRVAITLAENIYKYIGGVISIDDLKLIVDNLISKNETTRFYHQYILKDTYESTLSNMFQYDLSESVEEDDTDTIIIEESDISDWAKASHK